MIAFFVAITVFSIDRFTKLAALKLLVQGRPIRIIPGVFDITLVLNNGAAFGLFKGKAVFFILLSLAVIAAILLYILKNRGIGVSAYWALGLILGGAFGNLVDRITLGRVVDFLDFHVWPVFNVADSCITVGAALIVLSFLSKKSGRP